MKQAIELRSHAKINLGLDVLGRRENGYHDVRMVMQTVFLYDTVKMEKTEEEGIFVSTNLFYLPNDKNNLAYRAAELLREEFHLKGGVRINLQKRIPVSAGLAGGSSNAAAVLVGMNIMYDLGLSTEDLMERGVTLGADVPYCIMRGTVLAEGIGEVLTPVAPMPKAYVLLAKPGINVSTPKVYQKLDELTIVEHPDIDGVLEGLQEQDLHKVASSMGNVLEQVTISQYPVIAKIKEEMLAAGALNAMMSGSGPTVFGIFEKKADAWKAKEALKESHLAKQIYVANIFNVRRDRRGN